MKQLLMICSLLFLLSSCYNDKADKLYVTPTTPTTCDSSNITYTGTIAPIMVSKCATAGCHDGSGGTAPYNLNSYSGVLLAVHSGTLLPALQHTGTLPFMPEAGVKIADCDINKIASWINNGAQND